MLASHATRPITRVREGAVGGKGDPSGIRTRVTGMRSRRTRPLYDGALPPTHRSMTLISVWRQTSAGLSFFECSVHTRQREETNALRTAYTTPANSNKNRISAESERFGRRRRARRRKFVITPNRSKQWLLSSASSAPAWLPTQEPKRRLR